MKKLFRAAAAGLAVLIAAWLHSGPRRHLLRLLCLRQRLLFPRI